MILLDGAMGTMLQAEGLLPGERPELLCIERPEVVKNVHKKYIAAGSNIIYANTFEANAKKLAGFNYSVAEVVAAAVKTAREAVDEAANNAVAEAAASSTSRSGVLVALDIGPIGELLEPYGTLTFEEAYEIFKEMLTAGEAAGADLVVFETFSDLYEIKAGVLAAKENTSLPVITTMSFEKNHRTFTGCSLEAMAVTLEGLGADALGINCSLGPEEILPMARKLASYTSLPLAFKPNAGLPDPKTGLYSVYPKEFAEIMNRFADCGMKLAGGCCGTSPDYISAMSEIFASRSDDAADDDADAGNADADDADAVDASTADAVANITVDTAACASVGIDHYHPKSSVCSPSVVVDTSKVCVIGERINPTGKKRFKQALIENDIDYILKQAIEQVEAGADILDVNVGLPEIDEPEMIVKVVKAIQSVTDTPLQIDSSDPQAIEAALRIYNGKPIVNSVNGEPEVMERIFPLIKKYGAAVVGLTLDKNGIPASAASRFEIAERIVNTAASYGIPRKDVYIDCLTLTVSAQQEAALETIKAVRMVTEKLGVNTVLGVSNISFGIPLRSLMNQTFLALALGAGLKMPIINPSSEPVMDIISAYRVLDCTDSGCLAYIEKYSERQSAKLAALQPANTSTLRPSGSSAAQSASYAAAQDTSQTASQSASHDAAQTNAQASAGHESTDTQSVASLITYAIEKGLKQETADNVKKMLESASPLNVIDNVVIPALDKVGELYESGRFFLPQLLNAASAASEGFEIIKQKIKETGENSVSKGDIIIATVKGDIHDIGKNIVKVILENYGYNVIDLGRDVAPEVIVKSAAEKDIKLVGLSALMTTTLSSMQETIKQLRDSGHKCKVMVGGAVLTRDYAKTIGADFYAKDAKEAVDIAKKVFG